MSSNYDTSSSSARSSTEGAASVPETAEQTTRREAFESQLSDTNTLLHELQDTETALEVEVAEGVPTDAADQFALIGRVRDLTRDMTTCKDSVATLNVSRLTLLQGDPGRNAADLHYEVANTHWEQLKTAGDAIREWCTDEMLSGDIDSPMMPEGYEQIRID